GFLGVFGLLLSLTLLLAAVLLAIRNHRRGRGDMRGAVCLGAATLAVQIGAWVIGGHHSASEGLGRLAHCLGIGLFLALVNGVVYLAIEPAIRRRWPGRVTAWDPPRGGRPPGPVAGPGLGGR